MIRYLLALCLALCPAMAQAQQGPPGYMLAGPTNGKPPSPTTGSEGQWFLDTAGNGIYGPKTAGQWSLFGTVQPLGPLQPAVRQITTNSSAPTYQDSATATFICRVPVDFADDASAVSVGTANYWISTSNYAETGSGSTVSAAVWVEYPHGNFTQMTIGGVATTESIASGAYGTTDMTTLSVPIPRGSRAWIWQRVITTSGAGRVLGTYGTTGSWQKGGGGCNFSAGGTTTPQNVGLIADNSTTTFRPLFVVGTTTRRSYGVWCDSRYCFGQGDTLDNGNADAGGLGKGFARTYPYPTPYISSGQTGESMISLTGLSASGRANTVAIYNLYASDIVNALGINDVLSGSSLTTIQGLYTTIRGYVNQGQQQWLTTLPPVSTSTDSWATTTNQTTVASNSVRVSVNGYARGIPSGYVGYFEFANACESAQNSGLWAVTGAAFGYTVDGTHGSVVCNDNIANNKFITAP